MTGKTISQALGAFVSEFPADRLSEAVIEDARWRFVDMLGVCLAGSRQDSAGAIWSVATAIGGRPEATAIGLRKKMPASLAGWVNGAIGHSCDYDDTNGIAGVHISTIAVPAAMAMAERERASGRECAAAMVLGAEIALRICSGAPPHQFHERGFHGTGIAGPFAGAAIGSRLLGLNAVATANAIGLAGSQTAGLLQGLIDGTWVKRLHPGWGIQAGITCALLAQQGFTGPPEVLEGKLGFFKAFLFGDEAKLHLDAITADLGEIWLLPQTTYKPYPNGAWNHSSMDAAAVIIQRERLRPTDIERIECYLPPLAIPFVCEPREVKVHPRSPYHMKFSLPYSVAMLVARGAVGADDYNERVLADPSVAAMAERVHCLPDPNMRPELFPARVTISTKDGRNFEQDMPAQRGGPRNPMKPSEFRAKFRANVQPSLGAGRGERLLREAEGIWDAPDVKRLMRLASNAGAGRAAAGVTD